MDKDTNTLREELENHICRFNDGEQTCDCFVEGFKVGFNQKLEEEREQIVNEIMNHKFNTINAETALMDGNIKLSILEKKVVIDFKELVELLQIIKNKKI